MNIRDRERDAYVYQERKKGRTFASIGADLGVTGNRVRQVYRRIDWEINRENSDAWRRDRKKSLAAAAEVADPPATSREDQADPHPCKVEPFQ